MKNSIVSKEYSIAATEILDLLNYIPKDLVKRIPVQLIDFFQQVSVEDYKPQWDTSQGLESINLTDKTKALLAMIYRNYLCSTEEKQEFDEKLFENEQKYQEDLRERYSPNDIFKNNAKKEEPKNNRSVELIEYRESKWYHKIFEKLLSLFKK